MKYYDLSRAELVLKKTLEPHPVWGVYVTGCEPLSHISIEELDGTIRIFEEDLNGSRKEIQYLEDGFIRARFNVYGEPCRLSINPRQFPEGDCIKLESMKLDDIVAD